MDIPSRLDDITREHGPDPVTALRKLLVCQGGFTSDAANAILERAADDILALLRTAGLLVLTADATPRRYDLAPGVRESVNPDLDAHPAHFAYFEAMARAGCASGDYNQLEANILNLEVAFEWALESGNPESAYWLYNGCSEFLLRRADHARNLDWLRRVGEALVDQADDYLWGAVQNSLGVAYQNMPEGSHHANLGRAITAYQETLKFHTPDSEPTAYAVTQHNLGTAYADLARYEDRAANLRRAIDAYHAALQFRTPGTGPLPYAATQTSLGTAHRELAMVEDRATNLHRALAAYGQALAHYTPETAPLDYAAAQNNLGNVYRDLAGVEADQAADHLERAIDAYRAALTFRTPEATPLAYAATQNNLGTAYAALAKQGNEVAYLRQAVEAYEQSLRFYTPKTAPLDYAATQNNLGTVFQAVAKLGDRAANLQRAVAAYQQALNHYTPTSAPLDYAKTQANLGLAYEDAGDAATAISCWREAERSFRETGAAEQAAMVAGWISAAGG
ncbi:MAG: tetratricopeptide repeat protein [Chloroflexi bacterium]|nr:tetratricopeptide repeat protein [Chloroflexota bacterium]